MEYILILINILSFSVFYFVSKRISLPSTNPILLIIAVVSVIIVRFLNYAFHIIFIGDELNAAIVYSLILFSDYEYFIRLKEVALLKLYFYIRLFYTFFNLVRLAVWLALGFFLNAHVNLIFPSKNIPIENLSSKPVPIFNNKYVIRFQSFPAKLTEHYMVNSELAIYKKVGVTLTLVKRLEGNYEEPASYNMGYKSADTLYLFGGTVQLALVNNEIVVIRYR